MMLGLAIGWLLGIGTAILLLQFAAATLADDWLDDRSLDDGLLDDRPAGSGLDQRRPEALTDR